MLTTEQFIASQKATVETLFGLTHKAFESVEKLVELNLQASKAALADTAHQTQAFMGVKDAQELMAMQASMLQPVAEKSAAYSRHLYDIATSTGTEFTKVAEAKAAEAQASVSALVDSVSKNAPAGSDSAVSIMKGAVTAAKSAMESMQKAVKQATEMAEANLATVTKKKAA
jgi:phasin family protein